MQTAKTPLTNTALEQLNPGTSSESSRCPWFSYKLYTSLLALVVLTLLLSGDCPAETKAVLPSDEMQLTSISDPQLSPDGKTIAYVVGSRGTSNIFLARVDGSNVIQLTSDDHSRSPRWSRDGSAVLFLGPDPQSKKRQIFRMVVATREVTQLSSIAHGVSSFQLSPDDTRFACVVSAPAARLDSDAKDPDVFHFTGTFIKRDGLGFLNRTGPRNEIWVIGPDRDAPIKIAADTGMDYSDPQWSPDGKRLAFVSSDPFVGIANTQLWVAEIGSRPKRLIANPPNQFDLGQPRWSPDGQQIAYIGGAPDLEDHLDTIWVVDSGGGTPVPVSPEIVEYAPTGFRWFNRGQTIGFTGQHLGNIHFFVVDLRSRQVRQITHGDRYVGSTSINETADILTYTAEDPTHPTELFVAKLTDGSNEHRLTSVNEAYAEQHQLQDVERFRISTADGDVDAFFMKPANWQPRKQFPMVLSVHGGPDEMYGTGFSIEFQAYASRGWAVLFVNPRGSVGYGAPFQRAIKLQWGGKPYLDLMAAVDEALRRYPWIDANRLGVTGFSYGGFMTDWIVSQTARFRAAVSRNGMSNLLQNEALRDIPFGHTSDFGGDIYSNPEAYWKYSAIRFADRVKTPILFVHGAEDYRVNLGQAEEYYRALNHFGVPTELVVFPTGNHRNSNSAAATEWVIYWFNRYLDGVANAMHPPAWGLDAVPSTGSTTAGAK